MNEKAFEKNFQRLDSFNILGIAYDDVLSSM